MDLTKYIQADGFYFRRETPDAVRRALAKAFEDRSTVRLWYGDVTTGRAWAEEHDVFGTIGRSCGPVKVPLLVEPGEDGGGHLLDHCIVRIDVVVRRRLREGEAHPQGKPSRSVLQGRTVYAHPSFHAGTWAVYESTQAGYAADVLLDGKLHARFRRSEEAPRFVDFMRDAGYQRA